MIENMNFTFENGSVPVGSYLARFVGIEEVPAGEFQEGMRWIFEIASGDYAGKRTSRITGRKPTPRNQAGKFIGGLLGKTFANGECANLAPCVGKTYLIVMGQSQGGASVVESVSLPPPGVA